MVNASEIEEHFEVVGSDGHHVGRVDHVLGDTIELAKMDMSAGFKHHLIPVSWASRIDDKKVVLYRAKLANHTEGDFKAFGAGTSRGIKNSL